MTADVTTVEASDEIADFMEVVTRERLRNLPVMRAGRLHGLVSVGEPLNPRSLDICGVAQGHSPDFRSVARITDIIRGGTHRQMAAGKGVEEHLRGKSR